MHTTIIKCEDGTFIGAAWNAKGELIAMSGPLYASDAARDAAARIVEHHLAEGATQ